VISLSGIRRSPKPEYNTKLRTVELLDLENMGIAIKTLVLCAVEFDI